RSCPLKPSPTTSTMADSAEGAHRRASIIRRSRPVRPLPSTRTETSSPPKRYAAVGSPLRLARVPNWAGASRIRSRSSRRAGAGSGRRIRIGMRPAHVLDVVHGIEEEEVLHVRETLELGQVIGAGGGRSGRPGALRRAVVGEDEPFGQQAIDQLAGGALDV